MKNFISKHFNYRNAFFALASVCTIIVLTSGVSWSTPGLNTRKVYLEELSLNGHKYVVATTGASDSPGVSVIHSAGCNCSLNKR